MAAANIACLLGANFEGRRVSSSSQNVLLIDWDLEAPGLHRYFIDSSAAQDDRQLGLVDYFYALRASVRERAESLGPTNNAKQPRRPDQLPRLEEYTVSNVAPHVDLIKAGRFDKSYGKRVTTFDWVDLFERAGELITAFREMLTAKYSYCLIDARTGVTDISGICTMLLPERLAAVFTPNEQSLSGLIDVIRDAVTYRKSSDDFRPLTVFPIPSRIDLAEQKLRQQWREDYQARFERLFDEIYDVKGCDLSGYFDAVQIPHISYYAYGEHIAVLEPQADSLSLRRNYEDLYERLIGRDFPCKPNDRTMSELNLLAERGPQRWEKKLTATDAQRQKGNPTGDIRLTQAGWEVDGKAISQTTYFRYDLFGGFEWSNKGEKVEEASVPFDVRILGDNYGINELIVSHKPTGEAGQHNYTTGLQWGPLANVTRRIDLTGKLFRLYAPPAGRDEPFFIEIV